MSRSSTSPPALNETNHKRARESMSEPPLRRPNERYGVGLALLESKPKSESEEPRRKCVKFNNSAANLNEMATIDVEPSSKGDSDAKEEPGSSNSEPRLTFFDIPWEIRQMIYDYCFAENKAATRCARDVNAWQQQVNLHAQLLRCCGRIHSEAAEAFYKSICLRDQISWSRQQKSWVVEHALLKDDAFGNHGRVKRNCADLTLDLGCLDNFTYNPHWPWPNVLGQALCISDIVGQYGNDYKLRILADRAILVEAPNPLLRLLVRFYRQANIKQMSILFDLNGDDTTTSTIRTRSRFQTVTTELAYLIKGLRILERSTAVWAHKTSSHIYIALCRERQEWDVEQVRDSLASLRNVQETEETEEELDQWSSMPRSGYLL